MAQACSNSSLGNNFFHFMRYVVSATASGFDVELLLKTHSEYLFPVVNAELEKVMSILLQNDGYT